VDAALRIEQAKPRRRRVAYRSVRDRVCVLAALVAELAQAPGSTSAQQVGQHLAQRQHANDTDDRRHPLPRRHGAIVSLSVCDELIASNERLHEEMLFGRFGNCAMGKRRGQPSWPRRQSSAMVTSHMIDGPGPRRALRTSSTCAGRMAANGLAGAERDLSPTVESQPTSRRACCG
jgi:hypothetical protein